MNSRPKSGSPLIYLIILVAIAFLTYSFYSQQTEDITRTPLTDIAAYVREGNVASIRIEGNDLIVELRDGDKIASRKENESTIVEQLQALGVTEEELGQVTINPVQPPDWGSMLSAGGSILLVVAMLVVGYMMIRQLQGANNQALSFGKSRARMYTGDVPSRSTFHSASLLDRSFLELVFLCLQRVLFVLS